MDYKELKSKLSKILNEYGLRYKIYREDDNIKIMTLSPKVVFISIPENNSVKNLLVHLSHLYPEEQNKKTEIMNIINEYLLDKTVEENNINDNKKFNLRLDNDLILVKIDEKYHTFLPYKEYLVLKKYNAIDNMKSVFTKNEIEDEEFPEYLNYLVHENILKLHEVK